MAKARDGAEAETEEDNMKMSVNIRIDRKTLGKLIDKAGISGKSIDSYIEEVLVNHANQELKIKRRRE